METEGKRGDGKEGFKKFSWLVNYLIGYFMQTITPTQTTTIFSQLAACSGSACSPTGTRGGLGKLPVPPPKTPAVGCHPCI